MQLIFIKALCQRQNFKKPRPKPWFKKAKSRQDFKWIRKDSKRQRLKQRPINLKTRRLKERIEGIQNPRPRRYSKRQWQDF